MTLPKTITLRLTQDALDAVPANPAITDGGFYRNFKKNYGNVHKCLICQAVRLRFPDVEAQDVYVYPGSVNIAGKAFTYSHMKHENAIRQAHKHPDTFKPFSIKLTREDA